MSHSSSSRQVTETRTVYGPDGVPRQETHTYTTGGGGGGGGGGMGFSNFPSGFGNMDINTPFGGMQIGGGGGGSSTKTVNITRPSGGGGSSGGGKSRYSVGWGSKDKGSRPTPAAPMKVDGKDYHEIKAQCLREGRLFEDPDFPANDRSLFYSKAPPRTLVWKRPKELTSDPHFFVGGASRFDIQQGELGDCWLLAAIANLTQYKDLLYRVVPEQSFSKDYAGIFHFQFWQYGKWVDIVIDDRLPTYYDRLVYMHSAEKNEFWSPLLEKAYAKLTGSYEALKGGATSEAMEDFTGGVTEMYDLQGKAAKDLFQIMQKAFDRSSMMGCSIDADPGKLEAELTNGLIMGHAYSITCVTMIDIQTSRMKGKIPMVRVRNPWGNDCEWNGAWSDKSAEWKFIAESERKEIGLTFDGDGEFWMAFSDWVANFQKLEICNLGPDAVTKEMAAKSKKRWEMTQNEGSWKRRVNAGGCRNYLDTFWTNPQYRVDVVDPDEDDEENMGTLLVALMQKERRKKRKEGADLLTMGYAIYKLKDPSCGPLDMRFFKYNASVAKSPAFVNLREVCGRHKLAPGQYCIIPSTFEPNQEGDILLRIYSEKPNVSHEMDEETGMADVQPIVHYEGEDDEGKKRKMRRMGFFDNIKLPRGAHMPQFFSGMFKSETEEEQMQFFSQKPIQAEPIRRTHYDRLANTYSEVPGFRQEPITTTVTVGSPAHEVTQDDQKQEDETKEAFRRIAGEDMEIDAYELQDILNKAFLQEFKFEGFTSDTCRSMVAMMDADRSGKLGFEEFKKIWSDMRTWKTVFKKHDKDHSGNFSSYELRAAFHSVGFRISNSTFNALVQRYCHRDGKIYFDDFIHVVVRMRTMFDIFKEMEHGGKAAFGLDQFIQTTMYS